MTVDASTLESYEGKDIILHKINDEGGIDELTGKVESASEFGMAFKEKGKRDFILVEPEQIEEIALAPVKAKNLTQKKLKPIEANAVRQHLLDRHGFTRAYVNGLTDEQAETEHNQIDHKDLGHRHLTADEVAKAEADKTAADSEQSAA